MPKATRTLSGASRDKYFRELFAAEPELPHAAAERLARACAREIAQLRVRDPLPDRSRPPRPRKAKAVAAARHEHPDPEQSAAKDADTGAVQTPAFDPYAFSLAALLKRNGRKALLARLESIHSAADLHRLAEAQHVAVPADVSDPAELRRAIADGTAQRLADRRAAAS